MTDFEVVLVDDHDLPGDWAIARRYDGRMVAFLRRSKVACASMLEEAWAAADECRRPMEPPRWPARTWSPVQVS